MKRLRLIVVGAAFVAALLSAYGCVNMVLPAVPNAVTGDAARPAALAAFETDPPVASVANWTERRAPLLRAAFEREVYGVFPEAGAPTISDRTVVAEAAFGGRGRVEQWTVNLGEAGAFNLALAIPTDAEGPVPVILMQTFCGNAAAFRFMDGVSGPLDAWSGCDGGWSDPIIKSIFGRYIAGPPFERVLDAGYALAIFYAGDVVPDSGTRGMAALEATAAADGERWGAIGAWAWLFSRAIDVLDADPRFDPERTAIWGHSRNGKSALVAAAFDPRVDAVIAHQSGKGGATLTRSYAGESVKQITDSYPHWFAAQYATYADNEDAIPVDQHQLIALIAPRPILFGNSIRDKWSDPEGAYRAVQGADPVYELFGSEGLDQPSMRQPNFDADLAFFLRPGRHGVTTQDWEYFLTFLDAHFKEG